MNFQLFAFATLLSSAVAQSAISKDQFNKGVLAYSASGMGTPPVPSDDQVYQAFVKVTARMSKEEAAMFFANSCWETGGLQFVEEIACKTGTCSYGKYYGRGYIQLTHDYNYKAAGKDLYPSEPDKLFNNPDLVAKPEDAWKTAEWFWKKEVRTKPGSGKPALSDADIKGGKFGVAVNVINGGLECAPGGDRTKANKRLAILKEVYKAWGCAGTPTLAGC